MGKKKHHKKKKSARNTTIVTQHRSTSEGTTKETTKISKDEKIRETTNLGPLGPWIQAVRDILEKEPWESQSQPVQLLPWLYLSDYVTVRDVDGFRNRGLLLQNGITHVLTTTTMDPRQLRSLKRKLDTANIQHFYCPGQDYEGYDMIGNHWHECRPFLEHVRNSVPQGKVVVHCMAGMNRSGVTAAAAMMCLEQKDLLEVVQVLKAKRGAVLSNQSFQTQLCALAQREGLLGNKPKKYEDENQLATV